MSSGENVALPSLDDPQLRALLPLLYVAWIDLDFDLDERDHLMRAIDAAPWLRPAAHAALAPWLQPTERPTPGDLAALRTLIGRIAITASAQARASVAALAAELAQSDEERVAVMALAAELGASSVVLDEAQGPPAPAVHGDKTIAADLRDFLDGDAASCEVRTRVRAFLNEPTRRAYGLSSDAMRSHTRAQLMAFAATGLPRLAFPGVVPGANDLRPFMAVFEELAHGDLSLAVKLGVQAGLYGGAVWALGTAHHHAQLAQVASLNQLGCFAMSEVGHGSNVADLETTATYDHARRELVIHTPAESARKEWIGGAAHDAQWAVVFAQLEVAGTRHGVHAMRVPIRDAAGGDIAGVRTGDCGHKMGLLGVDNGRLWFEHARIPVANLLDRFAWIDEHGAYQSPIENPGRRFFTTLGTLVGGRICVGSASVSAARTGLAIAVRYAATRRQFGAGSTGKERALLDYPSHRRRLLPHLATSVVLRTAFAALRDRHAAAITPPDGKRIAALPTTDTRQLEAEVAALKILGSRHGVDALQACREACGGQGYLSVNRIADLRSDVEVFTTFEGDNTVLAQLVGKALLSGYQHEFAGGGPLAVVRALLRRAATEVVEANPAQIRRTALEHLRSRDFHLSALRYRERHIVITLAARLRKRLGGNGNLDAAMLAVQEHVIAAAHAFADRLAFDAFVLAESKASQSTREVLTLVGDLHALVLLERDAAWYEEAGYLDASKARAIRKQVEMLLTELTPHARTIVDAFAIPDACLAAPIAFFDPAHPAY